MQLQYCAVLTNNCVVAALQAAINVKRQLYLRRFLLTCGFCPEKSIFAPVTQNRGELHGPTKAGACVWKGNDGAE